MDPATMAFAFSAGLAAFLAPCAFPLLPSYVSYYLELDQSKKQGKKNIFRRGFFGGLACAAGAVLILGLIGIVVSVFGGAIASYIPKLRLVVGGLLIFLGAVMISNKSFSFQIKAKAGKRRGYLGLFSFGIIYALGSAGCVAPVFLGVLSVAMSSGLVGGLVVFLSYSFGLSLLMVLATLMIVSAREIAMEKLRKFTPRIKKLGGFVMIVVGLYLIALYFVSP